MSHLAQKRPFASLIEEQQEPVQQEQQQFMPTLMTLQEKRFCVNTVKALMKHKRAIAFKEPVDPVAFNIPDYFDVVKKPMDLGTVKTKLETDQYNSMKECMDDIQLIFDNCYSYNNAGDPVCLDANKLEESFKKALKKAPTNTPVAPQQQQHVPVFDDYSNNIVSSVTPEITALATIDSSITTPTTIPSQQFSNANQTIPVIKLTARPQQLPSATIVSTTKQQPITVQNEIPQTTATVLPSTPPQPQLQSSANTEIDLNQVSIMPEDQFKRCEAIIKEFKKAKHQEYSFAFAQPVDAAAWGATDYYDIIKNPMDMQTYERKLYEYQYTNEDELASDIRLMFSNCYIYNPPEHPVHELGKKFERVFEKYWAKIHGVKSETNTKRIKSSKQHVSGERSKRRRSSQGDEYIPSDFQMNEDIHMSHNGNLNNMLTNVPTIVTTTATTTNIAAMDTSAPTDLITQQPPQEPPRTILRLKLSVKPKEETEKSMPKPVVSIPGLALSKEPPSATPKLAINSRITSPIKEKKSEGLRVLPNLDKWMRIADNKNEVGSPTTPVQTTPKSASFHNTGYATYGRKQPQTQVLASETKKTSPPPSHTPQAPKPDDTGFDISQIFDQITNDKKKREQSIREENKKWENAEKIRQEKERMANEAKLERLREYNKKTQAKRQRDKEEIIKQLNENTLDISKQKMVLNDFESQKLMRDKDWKNIFAWQRDTVDYRHLPVPGFIKRSPISLSDLRKKLSSKCVRLKNSKGISSQSQKDDEEMDEDSDMDID